VKRGPENGRRRRDAGSQAVAPEAEGLGEQGQRRDDLQEQSALNTVSPPRPAEFAKVGYLAASRRGSLASIQSRNRPSTSAWPSMKPATSPVVTEASTQHGQKSRCAIAVRF
jgi:hypothetical protein